MDFTQVLPSVELIAKQAGDLINSIYQGGVFEHEVKEDNTPVTSADYAAHELVVTQLQALTPDIPVLSEEDCDIPFTVRSSWSCYWLVDPLDGTQEFVAASGDFTCSIALIEHNQPVMGVIYAPVHKLLYSAAKGLGATKELNGVRSTITIKKHKPTEEESLVIAVSRVQKRTLITDRLNADKNYQFLTLGSSTLKSCLVAEGGADCYIRIGPTGEWDTGAAECILVEAGGQIRDLNLRALSYNRRESLENPNFIALGDAELDWKTILAKN